MSPFLTAVSLSLVPLQGMWLAAAELPQGRGCAGWFRKGCYRCCLPCVQGGQRGLAGSEDVVYLAG